MKNIPEVIQNFFDEMDKIVSGAEETTKKDLFKSNNIMMEFQSLGRNVRNKFLYGQENWQERTIPAFFIENKVWHPDDMSVVMLESWVQYFRKEDFDFMEFMQEKKENSFDPHWIKFNCNPDTGEEKGDTCKT